MFDHLTDRQLLTLSAQLAGAAVALARRIDQLAAQAAAARDTRAELGLLLSAGVALAALDEKAEMSHAITLESARRDAETDQHQMGNQ
jgi:hypothetical protein